MLNINIHLCSSSYKRRGKIRKVKSIGIKNKRRKREIVWLRCLSIYPIVAHNCPFDRKFLVYYQWIAKDYPAFCSMRAIKRADNTLDSYALHNLVKHFKVANEVDHTAMSDIINVYEILKKLKRQI